MPSHWGVKIFGFILAFVGVIMIIISIVNYFNSNKFMKNSTTTVGIVVRNEVKGTGTLIQKVSYIEFIVNDKTFECFNTFRRGDFEFQIGDSVEVRYQIGNPDLAYINDDRNIYWGSKGMILMANIALVAGLLIAHFAKEIDKLPAGDQIINLHYGTLLQTKELNNGINTKAILTDLRNSKKCPRVGS